MSYEHLFDGAEGHGNIVITGVPAGSRFIVTSDQQIPFQDDALLDIIYNQFARDFKPKTGEYHHFITGDLVDLFSLSKFPPRVVPKFKAGDEVDMARSRLSQWAKRFTHNHFAFGNHEDRWDKTIFEGKLGNFTLPLNEVLGLDELGYDWVPYGRHYDFEGFILTHGDKTPIHVAKAMLDTYKSSGTSGHVNRPQSFTWADAANGKPITWYCTGMTCRTDIGDVIKDWRRTQPWQQGFGYGIVEDGIVHFQLARVHHGGFYAAGRFYKI